MSDSHPVTLYNTRTREREAFRPIDPANVRIYVCGPTVYDHAHIGNARPVIVFDVLFRLLRHVYGADHVTYVRNVTDVEDKINARAAEEGVPIRDLTERTLAQFHADIGELGALTPTEEPRATDHVDGMVRIIETLVARGHAYAADGHVLFEVATMPDYGSLARRSLDEMRAGARVEVAPYKRDAMDFVLWKPSTAEEPGWNSPWGRGRPGWHIECSAMARALLGEVFDIHGGGIDLVFPHHENEVAQSRAAFGTDLMANVWMHNGFLQVEGQKMSKSLGNFLTIRDLLDDWPGEVLRLTMLRSHYRQPIDWTVKGLEESRRVLDRWYAILGDVRAYAGRHNPFIDGDQGLVRFLADDLNTPEAITHLHALAGEVVDDHEGEDRERFKAALNFLGLGQQTEAAWKAWRPAGFSVDETAVAEAIAARARARADKDWAEADRIRDALSKKGIRLMDARDPDSGDLVTTWEVAR